MYPLQWLQQKLTGTNRKWNSSTGLAHLQGRPHVFILRLYFIFRCVQKHANRSAQVNSATRKLLVENEAGMETVLQSYWPSVQAPLTHKCILGKLAGPLWWQTRSAPASGTPSMAQNLSGVTVNDNQVVFDTLSIILKGTMDTQRKLSATMGTVACCDTVL